MAAHRRCPNTFVDEAVARRALLISFQFPPFAGSSAVERSLRFAQYLPEFGWDPIVLTAHERAFARKGSKQLEGVLQNLHIERSFTLDAARDLSIRGWYPRVAALPDRWWTWVLSAVPAGLRLIKRFQPEVIWATYPVPSTMLVGLLLHRCSGLPWIADFRDPMYDDTYPHPGMLRKVHQCIDAWTIRNCTKAVFTAPGAVRQYRDRYPDVEPERFDLIANGYDEATFADLVAVSAERPVDGRPITLLHSGVVYPTERDPTALFGAISDLARDGQVVPGQFELVLRASGHDALMHKLAGQFGIEQLVSTKPPIPYKEALAEMANADGLVVLQGDDCESQIPAKVYEYMRIGRPILGLVGEATDTAKVLLDAGVTYLAPLASRDTVREQLARFIADVRAGRAQYPRADRVQAHSRRRRTADLARLFDAVTGLSEPKRIRRGGSNGACEVS